MNTRELPAWLSELYPFTAKRFDTGSGKLSYLDEGQGDEAVLMVHGNPTWSFFYRNVVLALRGRIRCIAPDHLGCGLSDKPQDYDYTLPNHVANLGRLLDSLNLRKIHLIVHDWGGPIGLGACLPRHDKLGKVVILNTAAFADTVVPARIRFCRIPLIGELAVRGFNGFAWPATWMAVTKPLPEPVKRGFLFPYDSWANRIATHRFVRDIPQGVGAPNDQALAQIEQEGGSDHLGRARFLFQPALFRTLANATAQRRERLSRRSRALPDRGQPGDGRRFDQQAFLKP
jgi:cis-3-alkyl-4-acyloxetan-2-one decarboxylase